MYRQASPERFVARQGPAGCPARVAERQIPPRKPGRRHLRGDGSSFFQMLRNGFWRPQEECCAGAKFLRIRDVAGRLTDGIAAPQAVARWRFNSSGASGQHPREALRGQQGPCAGRGFLMLRWAEGPGAARVLDWWLIGSIGSGSSRLRFALTLFDPCGFIPADDGLRHLHLAPRRQSHPRQQSCAEPEQRSLFTNRVLRSLPWHEP